MSRGGFQVLRERFRKTDPERNFRLDERSEYEIYRLIRIKRSDFFMITVHVTIVIVIAIALFSTLVSNTSIAPYVTAIWIFPLVFFLISQSYSATQGIFRTYFWVAIVVQVLVLVYLGWVVTYNIIACGVKSCYSWPTLVVYALIAFINFIVWLAYFKVIITVYQIGANFVRLEEDFKSYRLRSNVSEKPNVKLFRQSSNITDVDDGVKKKVIIQKK